ncbi:MAG: hypothetical protein RSA10_03855 [Bacilli bacterium]
MEYISKIFFEEIIPEVIHEGFFANDVFGAVSFNTNIVELGKFYGNQTAKNPKPVLVIKNVENFSNVLEQYVNKALPFYFNKSSFSHDDIKETLGYAFSNATYYDFSNPVEYLKIRTAFLDDNLPNEKKTYLGFSPALSSEISIFCSKEKMLLETPYSLTPVLNRNDEEVALPKVMIGINGETCYIYALQNKVSENTKFKKEINRLLFKLDSGFIEPFESTNNVENPENLTGVTKSFLASLIITFGFLKSIGINNVIVPSFLPVRYNSHVISFNRRMKYYESIKTDKDKIDKIINDHEKEMSYYQENTTMKFIRTFRRIVYQSKGINVSFIPMQKDDSMHISITNEVLFDNDLENNLYVLAQDAAKKTCINKNNMIKS